MQESDLNDAGWNEVVRKRLPSNLEAKAIELKAWSRQRQRRCVSDLLRALLVYACCGYSWRDVGIWAVFKGIGSLSERAWRKRLDRAQGCTPGSSPRCWGYSKRRRGCPREQDGCC